MRTAKVAKKERLMTITRGNDGLMTMTRGNASYVAKHRIDGSQPRGTQQGSRSNVLYEAVTAIRGKAECSEVSVSAGAGIPIHVYQCGVATVN